MLLISILLQFCFIYKLWVKKIEFMLIRERGKSPLFIDKCELPIQVKEFFDDVQYCRRKTFVFFSLQECSLDSSTIAYAFVYFEKLVLKVC